MIAIFGIAWMGDTFLQGNMGQLTLSIQGIVQQLSLIHIFAIAIHIAIIKAPKIFFINLRVYNSGQRYIIRINKHNLSVFCCLLYTSFWRTTHPDCQRRNAEQLFLGERAGSQRTKDYRPRRDHQMCIRDRFKRTACQVEKLRWSRNLLEYFYRQKYPYWSQENKLCHIFCN